MRPSQPPGQASTPPTGEEPTIPIHELMRAGMPVPGDSPPAAKPRRGSGRLFAVAAGVVLVLGVGLAIVLGGGSGSGTQAPAAAAKAGDVRVRVLGVPEGGEVRFDGRVVGPDFTVPTDGGLHRVEIVVPGRETVVRMIRPDADVTLDIGGTGVPNGPVPARAEPARTPSPALPPVVR